MKWIGSLFVAKIALPVWAILLVMLAPPAVIIIVIRSLMNPARESHFTYIYDRFFEIDWYWRYLDGRIWEKYIIPRCPNCKSQLQPFQESGFIIIDHVTLRCHHCGFNKRFEFNYEALLDRVKREVDRKIVTGEYKIAEQDTLGGPPAPR